MSYRYAILFKWVNLVMDYLLLNLILFVVSAADITQQVWSELPLGQRISILALNLLWFFSASVAGMYGDILRKEAVSLIKTTLTALVVYMIAVGLFMPLFEMDGTYLLYILLSFSLLLLTWKTGFLALRKIRRKYWIKYRDVVIIGANQVGQNLSSHIKGNPHLGYRVAGFFDDTASAGVGEYLVLGKVSECIPYALANGIPEVYCALQGEQQEQIKELMLQADKHLVRFKLVPDFKALYEKNVMLDVYGNIPILSSRQEPLENKANEVTKRLFDVAFSLFVMLFLLSWFVPLMAIIIKLDSKGPVFFKQLRSGKGNRPFYCLKFRSMAVNADSDTKQATKGDARITRVGAFMRKTSIDELPQFINVFFGDMSVVGPRPHMLKHTEDYSQQINNFMVRHFLTPGITGWAQVTGCRGETKDTSQMEKRVEADIWYLENWNLLLDLKIIFLTVWNAVRGEEEAF